MKSTEEKKPTPAKQAPVKPYPTQPNTLLILGPDPIRYNGKNYPMELTVAQSGESGIV